MAGAYLHACQFCQRRLNPRRVNVLASTNNQILVSAVQVHNSVLVNLALVAGLKPLAGVVEVERAVVLACKVAPNHGLSANMQLANLSTSKNPRGSRSADANSRAWKNFADTWVVSIGKQRVATLPANERCPLAHPIRLDRVICAESLEAKADVLVAYGRAADGDHGEVEIVSAWKVLVREESSHQCRCGGHDGALFLHQRADSCGNIKRLRREDN